MPKPDEDYLDVYVDTDFAGCAQTRRSTSGGIVVYHVHCVKHWSVAQTTLSLSSGESELHGISKGVSMGLGMKSIIQDMGLKVRLRIHSDACAAIGWRDVEVWVECVTWMWRTYGSKPRFAKGHVDLLKVAGSENPDKVRVGGSHGQNAIEV